MNTTTTRALVAYNVLRPVLAPQVVADQTLRELVDMIARDDPKAIPLALMSVGLPVAGATALSYAIKEAWLGLSPLEPDETVVAPPVAFKGMSPRQSKVYDILCGDWWWSHNRPQDEIREAAEQIGDAESDDLHEVTREVIGSHEGWEELRDKIEEAVRLDIIDRQQAALELYAD